MVHVKAPCTAHSLNVTYSSLFITTGVVDPTATSVVTKSVPSVAIGTMATQLHDVEDSGIKPASHQGQVFGKTVIAIVAVCGSVAGHQVGRLRVTVSVHSSVTVLA
jgi:hypothetical protein